MTVLERIELLKLAECAERMGEGMSKIISGMTRSTALEALEGMKEVQREHQLMRAWIRERAVEMGVDGVTLAIKPDAEKAQ